MKRRKALVRRQLEECVTIMFLLEMILLSRLVPPARAIWCKERSSHWWEHVVNTTFTPQDCMSCDTFLHLCDYLTAAISKTNTIMRTAVQTEKPSHYGFWQVVQTTGWLVIYLA